jgi:putative tryptophan/tyrosine transport system substrate-binding protein
MRRREFITALGGVAATAAWARAGRAQQSARIARIGMLVGISEGDPEGQRWVDAFVDGLGKFGWKRGSNLQIDLRWAGADPDRMQKFAEELVGLQPDLIQTTTTPVTAAVLRATSTIPVVFAVVTDPVGAGFVQSFPHPGGNATGFVNIEPSVGSKWLETLKEIAPLTSRVGIMFNPKTAPQSASYLKSMEPAAASLALPLTVAQVTRADQIKAAITELAKNSNPGLIVTPDVFTYVEAQRNLIISLAAQYHIPTVYVFTAFVKAGGLVSYGVDNPDLLRRAAEYADHILRGAKPQTLLVQLPTKFEMAVNLKTAKALGLAVPQTLLATADEVIE